MSVPTPALFAGRKQTPVPPKSDSSTPSSDTKVESEQPVEQKKGLRNKEGRVPRLLVNHPELEGIMTRLKEDEQINAKHGWYDRNRNGNRDKKREQDRAAGKLRSQRTSKKA